MQDVAAGHIQLLHISLSSAQGALGVGQGQGARHPGARALRENAERSVDERILPAFRKPSTWFGFFGPAKLPPDILARLNPNAQGDRRARRAGQLEASDMTIIAGTPEEFAALQQDGIEQFGEIIKAAGIQPQ